MAALLVESTPAPVSGGGRTPPDSSRWLNSHERPAMLEWMTSEEWTRRFPNEHVAVIDPESDASDWVIAGWVFCHNADRKQLHKEIMRLRPKRGASPYTGKDEEGAVYIL